MKINTLIRTLVFGLTCLAASYGTAAEKPNVLVIYMDDMGWAQPGCYGGKMAPTPNIDALAAGGVRFTDGYVSACICSPSRVGLMTGRYQARSGHDTNPNRRPETGLALTETTFGQCMKTAGYTTGIVGKWHLGTFNEQYMPASRGFDFSFGTMGNLGEEQGPTFYRGLQAIADPPGAPITSPIYARESVQFIEANREKPWFLYLSFNAVHAPHVASEKWLEKFKDLPKHDKQYAALLAEADEAIGTVMAKLRDLKQEENTLIFLISDNGGSYANAEMGGLRGHKWFCWEGGIRVSWIVAWKGHVPGGRVCRQPVIQLDVLPTALAAAGTEVKPEWQLDGVNLLPLLEGKIDTLAPRALYFRFGVQYAVRQGDWKLVKASKEMDPMLVNLASDPGEQKDLSAKNPAKKQELQTLFDTWNASMKPPVREDLRWNGDEDRKANKKAKKQKRMNSLIRLLLATLVLAPTTYVSAAETSATTKPNIIYVMIDELGYYEPSFMGNKNIQTPNVDKLATAGIRFNNIFGGSAVCAPTRCCFLTGKHSGHTSVRVNGDGTTYSQYVIHAAALKFIRDNAKNPFFAYLPYTPPYGNFDTPA